MPRQVARAKRSRSPPPHSNTDNTGTVRDELRFAQQEQLLASAEAELAELRAKSNAIDTLLGEGFLETKEVKAILARSNIDGSNYAERSCAGFARRHLQKCVMSTLWKSSPRLPVGMHEIDHATAAQHYIPAAVVPTVVSERVMPYTGSDWLVVMRQVRMSTTPPLMWEATSRGKEGDENTNDDSGSVSKPLKRGVSVAERFLTTEFRDGFFLNLVNFPRARPNLSLALHSLVCCA